MGESMSQQKRYRSYLLRLWQEEGGNPPLWRASLESPGSGERRGFASLAALFDFLENEIAQGRPGASADEKGREAENEHHVEEEQSHGTDDNRRLPHVQAKGART